MTRSSSDSPDSWASQIAPAAASDTHERQQRVRAAPTGHGGDDDGGDRGDRQEHDGGVHDERVGGESEEVVDAHDGSFRVGGV